MTEQKALVVYYSRTGTTRKVAEAIAGLLQCDIEEVVDTKKRAGALGFIGGGKDAKLKKLTVIEDVRDDPGSYDLVIIGTPVWAWTMSPAIRTYITQQGEKLRRVAFFLTTGGSGIESTFDDLKALCDKEPVAVLGLKQKEVLKGDPTAAVKAFVSELRA
ncbi:MAG: flavodoxin family protein [Planctomycetota bacterium]|jgi:flavodoxin